MGHTHHELSIGDCLRAWAAVALLAIAGAVAAAEPAAGALPPGATAAAAPPVDAPTAGAFAAAAPAAGPPTTRWSRWADPLARRNAMIIGGSAAALFAWGYERWWKDGFDDRIDWRNEGWFGRGTEFGGIDKLGHMYSSAVGVRVLGALLEEAGNSREQAARLAFWSTTVAFAGIELLDGLSKDYSVSVQDMVFNLAGSSLSALLLANERLDRLIDFRLSYSHSRHVSGWEPFADYEGQTYHLVLKAEGIPALAANPVARYLEMGVGYRARGFDVPAGVDMARQRELQLWLGLNLSRLLGDALRGSRFEAGRLQRAADLGFELIQSPLRAGPRWGD